MAFIDAHRDRWSVAAMCRVLEFSQRTYYAAKARPASVQGQPIYDGIEQARIEAIGANALGGVRLNLTAVHEQVWAKRAFNQIEALANPPYADVVSLMVRERLTGEKPPAMAQPLVALFRDEIEANIKKTIAATSSTTPAGGM